MKKEKIDLIHFQTPFTLGIQAILTAKILKKPILGTFHTFITDEQYIQHLADNRLTAVGMKPLYNVANPIKWVDDFSKFNDQKTNFFEGTVTNYSKGSLSFDDF